MQTEFSDPRRSMKANFYYDLVDHLRTKVNPTDYNNFPPVVKWEQLPAYTVPSNEIIKMVDMFNVWYPKRLQTNLLILKQMSYLETENQVTFVYQTCNHLIWILKAYLDLYIICKRYITEKESIQVLHSIKLICRNVAFKTKTEAKRLLGTYPDMSYDVESIYANIKADLTEFF